MNAQNTDNLLRLPAEIRNNLLNSGADIEKAKKALDTLKALQVDVSKLREMIEWADTVRTTLLRDFK